MASNSTISISISFKIADGADGLKKLTVDAEALRKVMKETVDISIGLKKNIINFAALCTGIDSVSNSFNNGTSRNSGAWILGKVLNLRHED